MGQPVEKVDDVEVGEEAVEQPHQEDYSKADWGEDDEFEDDIDDDDPDVAALNDEGFKSFGQFMDEEEKGNDGSSQAVAEPKEEQFADEPAVVEDEAPAPAQEETEEPEVEAEQPEAEPTEVEEEETAPQQPEAKVEVPKQEQTQQPQLTAEEYAENRGKQRNALVDYFGRSIGEEAVDRLQNEPEKVLSELAADLYLTVAENMLAVVREQVPQYVDQVRQHERTVENYQNAFFKQWPELDKGKHWDYVEKTTNMYMTANPNATAEEVLRDVGAATLVAHKITPKSAKPAPVQAKPVARKAPPPLGGGKPGAGSKQPQKPKNMFSSMALDDSRAEEL